MSRFKEAAQLCVTQQWDNQRRWSSEVTVIKMNTICLNTTAASNVSREVLQISWEYSKAGDKYRMNVQWEWR